MEKTILIYFGGIKLKFKKALKIVLFVSLILILIFLVAFFSREFVSNYYVRLNLTSIKAPSTGSRVLIFSPHNDDEVLSSANLIRKTLQSGGQVKVVFITNGDGFKDALEVNYLKIRIKPDDYINFGYLRQKESIEALKSLGLPESDITFLGYPDGGISFMLNTNWDLDNPYTSEFTGVHKSPYSNSYTKNAPYSGQSLVSDISKIVADYKPTHIIYPHPNDRHPDHWATNVFVRYVLTTTNYKPQQEWLYLVHRGDWPTPMKKENSMFLVPPAMLIDKGTDWYTLDMGIKGINEKTNAINLYRSQHKILGPLMDAFERKNELFGVYPNPKIAQHSIDDSQITPSTDNMVINDPLQDAISLQIEKNADISEVYTEISKSNNLHVFIKPDGDVEELTTYRLNMMFFNGDKVSRLSLSVKNGKLTANKISKQFITDISGAKLETKNSMVHITLPSNITGDYQHAFINAQTFVGNTMLDRTAWRMLEK